MITSILLLILLFVLFLFSTWIVDLVLGIAMLVVSQVAMLVLGFFKRSIVWVRSL